MYLKQLSTLFSLILMSQMGFASLPSNAENLQIEPQLENNLLPDEVTAEIVDSLDDSWAKNDSFEGPSTETEEAYYYPRSPHRIRPGYGYPRFHYYPRPRYWGWQGYLYNPHITCYAQDPWGNRFWGRAPQEWQAADAALWECGSRTGYRCWITNCHFS